MDLVKSNTPWDWYKIDGVIVHVKREDMCCPEPGPSFSKIRGVERHVRALIAEKHWKTPIGVLDTVHSKAGWGVAYICRELGITCYDFFPIYKNEHLLGGGILLRESQRQAKELGAIMCPLSAGRSAILYHAAKKQLDEFTGHMGYMMPNALKLPESVEATVDELVLHTPNSLLKGTWIVSASSGTLAAGVLKGLLLAPAAEDVCLIVHMGYSRPEHSVRDYILKMTSSDSLHIPWAAKIDMVIVDEGYEYKDAVKCECPFPCNEFYDLKAWKWLSTHAHNLQTPIVFWNVGS